MTILKKIGAFIVATLAVIVFLAVMVIVGYIVMSYLRMSMIKTAGVCWPVFLNALNYSFPVVWGVVSLFFAPTIWRKTYLNLSA